MVEVGEHAVRGLAKLARLRLAEDEIPRVTEELRRLLEYVGRVAAVGSGGAPEDAHAGGRQTPLREDAARPGLPRSVAMAGAPASSGPLFAVPKVVAQPGPEREGEADA